MDSGWSHYPVPRLDLVELRSRVTAGLDAQRHADFSPGLSPVRTTSCVRCVRKRQLFSGAAVWLLVQPELAGVAVDRGLQDELLAETPY